MSLLKPLCLLCGLVCLALGGCVFVIAEDGMDGHFWGHGWERSRVPMVHQARDVEPFTAVNLSTSGDVRIEVGPETALTVRAEEGVVDLVETTVVEGLLLIDLPEGTRVRQGIEVWIATPTLTAVDINGSGDVEVDGLNGETFSASISGSGDLWVNGRVKRLEAAIRGSGDMQLFGLQAEEATVSITGSGDVKVRAATRLSASISGSGDVLFRGDPERDVQVAGSGEVRAD